MSKNITVVDSIRRARFEAEVTSIMKTRNPRQHAVMKNFSGKSGAFANLQKDIVDHYFFEQRQLSPLFCVDAMVLLVDRTLETMQTGLKKAA